MHKAYLVIINALAFGLMHLDKKKAKTGAWRIPEATLLTVAALGGSIGAFLGMHTARHKTRKPRFSLGIPAMLLLHMLLALYLRRIGI